MKNNKVINLFVILLVTLHFMVSIPAVRKDTNTVYLATKSMLEIRQKMTKEKIRKLAKMGEKARNQVSLLINSFYQQEEHIQVEIIRALARIKGEEAVKLLIQIVSRDEKKTDIHGLAAWALGEIKDDSAYLALLKAMEYVEKDELAFHFRSAVAKALPKLDPDRKRLWEILRIINLEIFDFQQDNTNKLLEEIANMHIDTQTFIAIPALVAMKKYHYRAEETFIDKIIATIKSKQIQILDVSTVKNTKAPGVIKIVLPKSSALELFQHPNIFYIDELLSDELEDFLKEGGGVVFSDGKNIKTLYYDFEIKSVVKLTRPISTSV